MKRFIAALCAGLFLTQELAYALPVDALGVTTLGPMETVLQDPSQFEIPFKFASLREVHKGKKDSLIVYFQDAHSNFGAQENMANALDNLMSTYGVSLVLSEGGSRDCSLSPLKKIASPDAWKDVARSYLLQGRIAGEEYLNLISDHPMQIIGIEDASLYIQSVQDYGELAGKRAEVLDYLVSIHRAVEKLKSKMYPKDLIAYERQNKKSFEEHVGVSPKDVLDLALRTGVSLKEFPALTQLAMVRQTEDSIDFQLARLEQGALFEKVFKGGRTEAMMEFAGTEDLRNSELSQYAHFKKTLNIAQRKNIDVAKLYPNFARYGEYLSQFSGIDLEALMDESALAEEKIYVTRLETEDQRLVRSIDSFLALLDSAYHIQMSSSEFDQFLMNEPDFGTFPSLSFINRKLAETGYFEDFVDDRPVLEEGKQALIAFYDSVAKRDEAFLRNAENAMRTREQKMAVMIVGGYHTTHMTRLLREKDYSYVVVSPQVHSETNQQKYEKQLFAPLEKKNQDQSTLWNLAMDATLRTRGSDESAAKQLVDGVVHEFMAKENSAVRPALAVEAVHIPMVAVRPTPVRPQARPTPEGARLSETKIIGFFPGLGSRDAYRDLGSDLYDMGDKSVRRIYEDSAKALGFLKEDGSPDPSRLFFKDGNVPIDPKARAGFTGAAFVVHNLALEALMRDQSSLNGITIRPQAYTGESFGILTAAIVSGALSLEDGVKLAMYFTPCLLDTAERLITEDYHTVGLTGPNLIQALNDLMTQFGSDVEVHRFVAEGRESQFNIYVADHRIAEFREFLLNKFPAITYTDLRPPTRLVANSSKMVAARRQLEQFIRDNGIEFKDPKVPIIANHERALITKANDAKQAFLALADRPMESGVTARLAEDMNADMIVEIGLGGRTRPLLEQNYVQTPFVEFVGQEGSDYPFYRMMNLIAALRLGIESLKEEDPNAEMGEGIADVMREAFVLAKQNAFAKNYLFAFIKGAVRESMQETESRHSPVYYKVLETLQNTYLVQNVLEVAAISNDALVLSAVFKKRLTSQQDKIDVELLTIDRKGRTVSLTLNDYKYPEVVQFAFYDSQMSAVELVQRAKALIASQPLASEIYSGIAQSLGYDQDVFMDEDALAEESKASAAKIVYQVVMFRLTQRYRPAIMGQNYYHVTGMDRLGMAVSLAVSESLSLEDAIRLYQDRKHEVTYRDAQIKIGDPLQSIFWRKKDDVRRMADGAMRLNWYDTATSIRTVFASWVVSFDPARKLPVTGPTEAENVLHVDNVDDLWRRNMHPQLDLLEDLSILRFTDQNGKVFRFAEGRGITTSNVYSYINAGETVTGFGQGGSESLVVFFRKSGSNRGYVRKVLSERLITALWDREGQGAMLPPFAKARRQAHFLRDLPEEAKALFPRVVDIIERDLPIAPGTREAETYDGVYHEMMYDMDFIEGVDVSDFIRKNQPSAAVVAQIYKAIFMMLNRQLHTQRRVAMDPTHTPTIEPSYLDKIEKRLALTRKTAPGVFDSGLLDSEFIMIDGKKYRNIQTLLKEFRSHPGYLSALEPRYHSLVMGDDNTENIKIMHPEVILKAMETGRIDFTAEDIGVMFLDPRAIGFQVNGRDTGTDDPMYDNKPWHNSIGNYDAIHGEYFDIESSTEEGTPALAVRFSGDNPFAESYRGMERYFKPVMTEVFELDKPDSAYLKEDPYWLLRYTFVMGTHFAAMPPFHFKTEIDGTMIDDVAHQKRAVAIYAEGIKWLNLSLDMLEGKTTEYMGFQVPQLTDGARLASTAEAPLQEIPADFETAELAAELAARQGAIQVPAQTSPQVQAPVFLVPGKSIEEQEVYLRDYFSSTPFGRASADRKPFITGLSIDRGQSNSRTLFVRIETLAGEELRFGLTAENEKAAEKVIVSFKVGFGANNRKAKELQQAYGDRGRLSADMLLALLKLLKQNGTVMIREPLGIPGSDLFFERVLGTDLKPFYAPGLTEAPYSIKDSGMRYEMENGDWVVIRNMTIDLKGYEFPSDPWAALGARLSERLPEGPADMSNESRVFFSPWSRLARGTGLGPHTVDYDPVTARYLRETFDALQKKVPPTHAYNNFSRLLTELILDVESGKEFPAGALEARTDAILRALSEEKAPYQFVTAASILIDVFAKLDLDPALLVNEKRDLIEESLQKVETIPFKSDGIYGYYERVTGYTGLFMAIGQLGMKERLTTEKDYIALALSQLETIPSPWNRGRGSSMLFAALKVLGYESYLTDRGRDYIKETLDYIDRADELNIWPTFPAVPLTHAYFTIEPYLTMLNAIALLGKPEYLTYKEDRIAKVNGMMNKLSAVETTLIGEYYLLTLYNLGVLNQVVPDLDGYLRHFMDLINDIQPAPIWFPNGVSYPYAMETAWFFGRSDLVTDPMIHRMIESMQDFTDEKDSANWGHPVSYILNTLGQMDRADLLFKPSQFYGGQAPLLWAVDRFAGNETGLQKSLPMFDHALISMALRMRGPRAETEVYRDVQFLSQKGSRLATIQETFDRDAESRALVNGWIRVSRGFGLGMFPADYDADLASRLKETARLLEEKMPATDPYNRFSILLTRLILDVEDPSRKLTPGELSSRTGELIKALREIKTPLLYTNASAILFEAYGKLDLDALLLVNPEYDLVAEAFEQTALINPLENTASGQAGKAAARGEYDKLTTYAQLFLALNHLGLRERSREHIEEALSLIETIPSAFARGRYASVLFSALKVLGYDSYIFNNRTNRDHLAELLDYMQADQNYEIETSQAAWPNYRKAYPLLLTLLSIGTLGRPEYLTHNGRDLLAEARGLMDVISDPAGDEVAKLKMLHLAALKALNRLDREIPDLDAYLRRLTDDVTSLNSSTVPDDPFYPARSLGYLTEILLLFGRQDLLEQKQVYSKWVSTLLIEKGLEVKRNKPYNAAYMLTVLGEAGRSDLLFGTDPRLGEAPFTRFITEFSTYPQAVESYLPMLDNSLINSALRLRGVRGARLSTLPQLTPEYATLINGWTRITRGFGVGLTTMPYDAEMAKNIRDTAQLLDESIPESGAYNHFTNILTGFILDVIEGRDQTMTRERLEGKVLEVIEAMKRIEGPLLIANASAVFFEAYAKLGLDPALLVSGAHDLVREAFEAVERIQPEENTTSSARRVIVRGEFDKVAAYSQLFSALANLGLQSRVLDPVHEGQTAAERALSLVETIPSAFARGRYASSLFSSLKSAGQDRLIFDNARKKDYLSDLIDYMHVESNYEYEAELKDHPNYLKAYPLMLLLISIGVLGKAEYLTHNGHDLLREAREVLGKLSDHPDSPASGDDVAKHVTYYLTALSLLGRLDSEIADLDGFLSRVAPEIFAKNDKNIGYALELMWVTGRRDLVPQGTIDRWISHLKVVDNLSESSRLVPYAAAAMPTFIGLYGHEEARKLFKATPDFDGQAPLHYFIQRFARRNGMSSRYTQMLNHSLIDYALRMRSVSGSKGGRLSTSSVESRVLFSPWMRLARGMGVGQHLSDYDPATDVRVRRTFELLDRSVAAPGAYHRFSRLLSELILDLENPARKITDQNVEVRTGEIVAALYEQTDAYDFSTSAAILMSAYAKLGLKTSLLINDRHDLLRDAISKAATIESKQDGVTGPYERVSAYTNLFFAVNDLGLADRLQRETPDTLKQALDLLDEIPSAWNRVRAGAVLFTAFKALGVENRLSDDGRDRPRELMDLLDASDESFGGRTKAFIKVFPLLMLLSALAELSRQDLVQHKQDRIRQAQSLMGQLTPVETLLMAQYYLMALVNLGRLDEEVPDLDAYLRDLARTAETHEASGDWFPNGVAIPYVIETLWMFGRQHLISERLVARMTGALPGNFSDARYAVNRDNPFAYALNALVEVEMTGRLSEATAAQVVQSLASNPRMSSNGLPTLDNALISLSLRMRSAGPSSRFGTKAQFIARLIETKLLAGMHSEEIVDKDAAAIVEMGKMFEAEGVIPEIGAGNEAGIAAIREYRKQNPNAIIAAGEIRETDPEQAVRAVKAGANVLVALENPIGAAVVDAVRRIDRSVVIIAAAHSEESALVSIRAGVDGIKIRPFALDPSQVEKNLELTRKLRAQYPDLLVGGSRGIKPVQLEALFGEGLQFVGLGVQTAIEGARTLAASRDRGARLAVSTVALAEPAVIVTSEPAYLTVRDERKFGYLETKYFWETHATKSGDARVVALAREVLDGGVLRAAEDYVDGRSLNTEERRIADHFHALLQGHFGKPWLGARSPEINYFILLDYAFFLGNLVAGYFQTGVDHFAAGNSERLGISANYLADKNSEAPIEGMDKKEVVRRLLSNVLYGNKFEGGRDFADGFGLALDQSSELADKILSLGPEGILDIFVDNVGPEFAANLQLAAYLTENGIVGKVRFHLKPYPYSFSDVWGSETDVLKPYVRRTLDILRDSGKPIPVGVAEAVEKNLNKKIFFQRDDFLVLSGDFRKDAAAWAQQVPGSGLVLVMGDYLYRKVFGNREWDETTAEEAASLAPAIGVPIALIRMVKSSMKISIPPATAQNNTVGVIQLLQARQSEIPKGPAPLMTAAEDQAMMRLFDLAHELLTRYDIPDLAIAAIEGPDRERLMQAFDAAKLDRPADTDTRIYTVFEDVKTRLFSRFAKNISAGRATEARSLLDELTKILPAPYARRLPVLERYFASDEAQYLNKLLIVPFSASRFVSELKYHLSPRPVSDISPEAAHVVAELRKNSNATMTLLKDPKFESLRAEIVLLSFFDPVWTHRRDLANKVGGTTVSGKIDMPLDLLLRHLADPMASLETFGEIPFTSLKGFDPDLGRRNKRNAILWMFLLRGDIGSEFLASLKARLQQEAAQWSDDKASVLESWAKESAENDHILGIDRPVSVIEAMRLVYLRSLLVPADADTTPWVTKIVHQIVDPSETSDVARIIYAEPSQVVVGSRLSDRGTQLVQWVESSQNVQPALDLVASKHMVHLGNSTEFLVGIDGDDYPALMAPDGTVLAKASSRISEKRSFTIGRAASNDLVLSADEAISRRHATLLVEGMRVTLMDGVADENGSVARSTYGITVNGEKLDRIALEMAPPSEDVYEEAQIEQAAQRVVYHATKHSAFFFLQYVTWIGRVSEIKSIGAAQATQILRDRVRKILSAKKDREVLRWVLAIWRLVDHFGDNTLGQKVEKRIVLRENGRVVGTNEPLKKSHDDALKRAEREGLLVYNLVRPDAWLEDMGLFLLLGMLMPGRIPEAYGDHLSVANRMIPLDLRTGIYVLIDPSSEKNDRWRQNKSHFSYLVPEESDKTALLTFVRDLEGQDLIDRKTAYDIEQKTLTYDEYSTQGRTKWKWIGLGAEVAVLGARLSDLDRWVSAVKQTPTEQTLDQIIAEIKAVPEISFADKNRLLSAVLNEYKPDGADFASILAINRESIAFFISELSEVSESHPGTISVGTFGSGNGKRLFLQRQFAKVHGLDVEFIAFDNDTKYIAQAKKINPDVRFVETDLTKLKDSEYANQLSEKFNLTFIDMEQFLHEVYSFGPGAPGIHDAEGRQMVRLVLEGALKLLKKDGRIILFDGIIPPNPQETVTVRLSNTYMDAFKLFAGEAGKPGKHVVPVPYRLVPDEINAVELSRRDLGQFIRAVDYLIRTEGMGEGTYQARIKGATSEVYQFFSIDDYAQLFGELGLIASKRTEILSESKARRLSQNIQFVSGTPEYPFEHVLFRLQRTNAPIQNIGSAVRKLSDVYGARLSQKNLTNLEDVMKSQTERVFLKELAARSIPLKSLVERKPMYLAGSNTLLRVQAGIETVSVYFYRDSVSEAPFQSHDYPLSEIRALQDSLAMASTETSSIAKNISLEQGAAIEEQHVARNAFRLANEFYSSKPVFFRASDRLYNLINLDDRMKNLPLDQREPFLRLLEKQFAEVRRLAASSQGNILSQDFYGFYSADPALMKRFVSDAVPQGADVKFIYHGDAQDTSRAAIERAFGSLGISAPAQVGFAPIQTHTGGNEFLVVPTVAEMVFSSLIARLDLQKADFLEVRESLDRIMKLLVDRVAGSAILTPTDVESLQNFRENYPRYSLLALRALEKLNLDEYIHYTALALQALGTAA